MTIKFVISVVIWLCFLSCLASTDELKIVHAIWRHGDRSPANLIPTDVNNTVDTWPQGLGELSQIGMTQELKLGQALNMRYSGNLVSVDYKQPEIYIRSDDYNRTLMSAMANLAGFYQNSTSQVNASGWPSPHWQPIPVHTIDIDTDHMINVLGTCPKADQIMTDTVMQQEDYKRFELYYKPLFDYLTEVCGFEYPITLDNIDDVYDPINCELAHPDEHTWPNYINDSLYEQIRHAHNISWDFSYSNLKIARLRGGTLLGDVIYRMQQKETSMNQMNDTSLDWVRNLKYYGYSAHDSTINAFLSTLGAEHYTGGQPGYSACVLLELYVNKTNDYYVRILYRQNDTAEFFPIQIKGCPDLPSNCSLNDLYKRSIDFIPTNWTQECSIDVPSGKSSTIYVFQGFFTLFATVLIAIYKNILEVL